MSIEQSDDLWWMPHIVRISRIGCETNVVYQANVWCVFTSRRQRFHSEGFMEEGQSLLCLCPCSIFIYRTLSVQELKWHGGFVFVVMLNSCRRVVFFMCNVVHLTECHRMCWSPSHYVRRLLGSGCCLCVLYWTQSVFLSAEVKGTTRKPNLKDREAFDARNILQVRNIDHEFLQIRSLKQIVRSDLFTAVVHLIILWC